MPNYDFTNLSPPEFEDIVRDLIQLHHDITLESFKEGADRGIDLRHALIGHNDMVIQCKRYKDFNSLKTTIPEEARKVKLLQPKRYIFVTSAGLSPDNKDFILKSFEGFIHSTSDIYGKDDLNNLIGKYPELERAHFKLWLSSMNILEKIFRNNLYNRSALLKEDIIIELRRYVQNGSFDEALSIMDKYNYVLISGLPGIGKSTLAKMLTYKYIADGYEIVDISSDIDEAFHSWDEGRKQVFFYDDFLGSNFLESKLVKNEDKRLISFIKRVKVSTGKKLILTTREYILNQAQSKYDDFNRSLITSVRYVVDIGKWNSLIRAKILYNHLFFSCLSQEYIDELLADERYLEIISHRNYNPRLIEDMTSREELISKCSTDYFLEFMNALENPQKVWGHVFEHQITDSARYVLLVLLFSGGMMRLDDLRLYFEETFRNTFSPATYDYIKSVKELEGSFISSYEILGDIFIKYQNPSVADYLLNYISKNRYLVKQMIESAVFFENFFYLFYFPDGTINFGDQVVVDEKILEILIDTLIAKFDSLKTLDIHRWEGEIEISLYRIGKLIYLHKITRDDRLRNLYQAEMQRISQSRPVSFRSKTMLIDILNKTSVNIDLEVILTSYCEDLHDFEEIRLLVELLNALDADLEEENYELYEFYIYDKLYEIKLTINDYVKKNYFVNYEEISNTLDVLDGLEELSCFRQQFEWERTRLEAFSEELLYEMEFNSSNLGTNAQTSNLSSKTTNDSLDMIRNLFTWESITQSE